jgi:hypothetical protein
MLDDRVSNKKGKFPALNEGGQQERVFGPERDRIKQPGFGLHAWASNGEPSSIQISNETGWLQHVIL